MTSVGIINMEIFCIYKCKNSYNKIHISVIVSISMYVNSVYNQPDNTRGRPTKQSRRKKDIFILI